MRVWLLEGLPGAEPGFQAWALGHLGFATWAPARAEVLEKLPAKYERHRAWLAAHGLSDPGPDPGLEVVEELRGDEVLFGHDREPAAPEEVDRTVELLAACRSDLLAILAGTPEGALDWDPPYERFLPWAAWRTVRQVLAHLANTETHYYLAAIGFQPPWEPVPPDDGWASFLGQRRAATLEFLTRLREAPDRRRIDERGWSVRKVLRRLVWHERLHTKSIGRILAAYRHGTGEAASP